MCKTQLQCSHSILFNLARISDTWANWMNFWMSIILYRPATKWILPYQGHQVTLPGISVSTRNQLHLWLWFTDSGWPPWNTCPKYITLNDTRSSSMFKLLVMQLLDSDSTMPSKGYHQGRIAIWSKARKLLLYDMPYEKFVTSLMRLCLTIHDLNGC